MKRAHSLLDYAKEVDGIKTVELLDLDIHLFDPQVSLESIDANTLYNVLSLIYHFEDTMVEDGARVPSNLVDRKQRYFCDAAACFRCGETGHGIRECPKAPGKDVCELCSWDGHRSLCCPYRLCPRCGRCGHSPDDCLEPESLDRSKMCEACPTGFHSTEDCPRTWKRYKLNRNTSKRTIYKACPICLSRKHFIGDCSENKPPSSIFTSSYVELAKFYNKQ
ncbi:similarity to DNA-BINDING PROTEIN HEXBP [Encephalitozoon cuniculi GB-M1]|uniref:Similarity to DNA-BINDING PROTEIN HEXBP n=1 Tax=Encephalitozoon cuniculi (strain GB-M1) TaxID=284813 RepID=Q8SU59_ENCCU|nr:mRNA-binding translational activator GIS2 [Encephalitozoon cuniculi GB-M1]KMV65023.1 zinc knuckle domain-containing protein [Encephalitozoon cuniculi EcunIII-L]UYI26268.1 hypothetical protein J0A71_01g00850 [Encephalitozoon cuniculi]CAD25975.1 similarity to DNA-BINDING PROTEIN HEXBP [Encephalitozoon cuniculi GB-M1]